ncbi:hypothetical protein FRX31_028258 [Thalictrum thalictroides]|uniref:Uncharacterized protein n=1 Tax=Thalictrum thalictroides TaxID=46969 RepID=A0A7J6VAP9_THATH|nr:hypothetical protein FRX31_028258 [Thalictrum thalictroides]
MKQRRKNPKGKPPSDEEDESSSIAIRGTIGYIPPEYGAGGGVSTQGDIYMDQMTERMDIKDVLKELHSIKAIYLQA